MDLIAINIGTGACYFEDVYLVFNLLFKEGLTVVSNGCPTTVVRLF